MNHSLIVQIVAAGVLYGTPLLIAALGELLSEKSGVMNLGIDGYMLMGAVSAFWVVLHVHGPSWEVLTVAILVAALAGALTSLVYAVACISLGANQLITGLAIWILAGATGLSSYIGSQAKLGGVPGAHSLAPLNVFGLKGVPVLGPIIFNQNALVYFSWGLVLAAWYYLARTRKGLHLKAVGEEPAAADALGISVVRYRYAHTLLAGAAAGVGGSFYTLAISPTWQDGITAGAGWIALSLVIVAFWRPVLILVGAYAFGVLTGLGSNLQAHGVVVAPELFSAVPYLMTIIALVLASTLWARTRHGSPKALGLAYSREGH